MQNQNHNLEDLFRQGSELITLIKQERGQTDRLYDDFVRSIDASKVDSARIEQTNKLAEDTRRELRDFLKDFNDNRIDKSERLTRVEDDIVNIKSFIDTVKSTVLKVFVSVVTVGFVALCANYYFINQEIAMNEKLSEIRKSKEK